jgi:hypothetical protein
MDFEPKKTINGFTRLLVEELIKLGVDGVRVTTRDGHVLTIKTRLVYLTADSPAKR